MRILHVVPYFAPAWAYGGVPRAVFEIAKLQCQNGHDVTVLTTDALSATQRSPKHSEKMNGVKVIRLTNISNWLIWHLHFCTPFGLPDTIDLEKFKVIHLHETRTVLNYLVLKKISQKNKVVFSPWGTLPYNHSLTFIKKAIDMIFLPMIQMKVNAVLGQNQHELKILDTFSVGRKKILLPLGIEFQPHRKISATNQFRKKLGVDSKTKIYLFLGRFSEAKGIELLFKVFAKFSKFADQKKQKVCLVCVGRDDGFLKRMKELVSQLGLKNILLHQPLYDQDRFRAYLAADYFVFTPIVYEETSTSCLEALSCGLPVLTTWQAEIPFLTEDDGVLQVEANFEEVLAGLKKTLTRKQIARKKIQSAAQKYFAWPKIVKQLEKIYALA